MHIGLPKEIKTEEYRVGLTPVAIKAFVKHGHSVLVQTGAGIGSGFTDDEYRAAGASIMDTRDDVYAQADMIVKVKEPLPEELPLLREGQILYTHLHLAANKELTQALLQRNVIGIAYETVERADGTLPLLTPMSEIAGRLSVQEGAKYLEKPFGGRGVLLGGIPGIRRGKVVILGGGVVGTNACKIAIGIGADVTVLDIASRRLMYLDDIFGTHITTLYSNESNIEESVAEADVVIGAVLIPGAAAPKLIKRQHLKHMRRGAVIVDVAVDQGGCCETSRATTHTDPVFIEDDVVHYCVANMPGSVALSSTMALTSVTYPLALKVADLGIEKALQASLPLQKGVNIYKGRCTYAGVAESLDIPYTPLPDVVSM